MRAVVGGWRSRLRQSPLSLYFPVNNRKKTGGRVQPGADAFPASYGMNTGNGGSTWPLRASRRATNNRTEQDENRK
jgi:hypothetical protein